MTPNFPEIIFIIVIFCCPLSCKTKDNSTTQKAPPISLNKNSLSKSKVDSIQIMADIKHLASDELEGRRIRVEFS